MQGAAVMNLKMILLMLTAFLACGGKVHPQEMQEGSKLPFKGFYRYGAWSGYIPPEETEGLILEAGGSYRITSPKGLLFKPGMFPADSVFIYRDTQVQEVVKGLYELKQDDRLTLWYGYGLNSDDLEDRKVGPFRYYILESGIPSLPAVLGNIDIIVVEKYPLAFYSAETAFNVKKWLMNGGTAVITSREAVRTRLPSVFAPFFKSSEGVRITSRIRTKWEQGGKFTPDEFYVIPAGFGKIIFFPTDKEETGIEINFTSRGNAWQEIASLSSPFRFPRSAERYSLSGNISEMLPISPREFEVKGKWIIILLYCIAALWLVFIAENWKRHLFLILLSGAAAVTVVVFYSPPDYITGSLSLSQTKSGSSVLKEYSFIKIVSFRKGVFTFTETSDRPYFPLITDKFKFQVQKHEKQYSHALALDSFQSRNVYTERLAELQNKISWTFRDEKLTIEQTEMFKGKEMYLFNEGILYSVPQSGGPSYRLSELNRIKTPSKKVLAALKAGNILNLSSQKFLLVFSEGDTPALTVQGNTSHLHSKSVLFIGLSDE